ncbi:MAG: hypothetical protein IJX12_06755 [Lachnospiraceae bacterium]|nr:hypothetical protein [Lachnospiraceae bacterium]
MFKEDTVYFKIDNNSFLLDKVLVEFDGEPIFFVCKSNNNYYIALNIDIESQYYILAPTSVGNLYKMLCEKITMRDYILQSEYFWSIRVGDDFDSDVVVKESIDKIPMEQLPYAGEFLSVVTQDLKDYRENIKNIMLGTDDWKDSNISSQITKCAEIVNGDVQLFARLVHYFTIYDEEIELIIESIAKDIQNDQYIKEYYASMLELYNDYMDNKMLIGNDNTFAYAA